MASSSPLTQTEITATGTFRSGATRVFSIILTPAAAIVTAVIRDGGAAGTVRASLQAAASGASAVWSNVHGVQFNADVHVTLTGVGVLCDIGWANV